MATKKTAPLRMLFKFIGDSAQVVRLFAEMLDLPDDGELPEGVELPTGEHLYPFALEPERQDRRLVIRAGAVLPIVPSYACRRRMGLLAGGATRPSSLEQVMGERYGLLEPYDASTREQLRSYTAESHPRTAASLAYEATMRARYDNLRGGR